MIILAVMKIFSITPLDPHGYYKCTVMEIVVIFLNSFKETVK